ncbi:sugar transferase [Algirhabdus cladophorae]|uniref:sugar transferase n=1 Tax=Algirhabdus cladophorae TaxID=3377108 RepID=UPI003B848368
MGAAPRLLLMTLNVSPASVQIDAGPATATPVVALARSEGIYKTKLKRVFDLVVSSILLILSLPIILVSAAVISLDGHNPFYSQLRVGKNNKTFRMWKLRTMVHGADDLLEAHLASNPEARREWDATQKLKKDPRITWIGRILRKTSLDELPQLFNIFNGTMSVVGPRPMMVCQRSSYAGLAYYNMRPGLTGLWQISDRNNSDFTDRVVFDERYNQVMSAKTDAVVVMKTALVVLRGTGY